MGLLETDSTMYIHIQSINSVHTYLLLYIIQSILYFGLAKKKKTTKIGINTIVTKYEFLSWYMNNIIKTKHRKLKILKTYIQKGQSC